MSNCKIAVLVHLYYTDMWDDIKSYLSNLEDYEYKLCVNLVEGNYDESIIEDIDNFKDDNIPTLITISPNTGVDIGGFLYPYREIKDDYEYILKIHTKKSLGTINKPSDFVKVHGRLKALSEGKVWFTRLMGSVLGSKDRVKEIIDTFDRDEKCGMIGLDKENYVGPNSQLLSLVCNKLSLPLELHSETHKHPFAIFLKNAYFVGGTMFWVRNSTLRKYLTDSLIETLLVSLPKGYQNEPSPNHVMERVFGVMVYNDDKKIITL